MVVGSGPAGASAARTAALAGARVLLLERAGALPRYKRCGGGLIGPSQAALRAAGLDVAALERDRARLVTITHDGRRPVDLEADLPLVLRADLDHALVRAARDAGAELRTGVTVTGYAEAGGTVALTTSAGPVRAGAVVAADGSQGRAASYVGVKTDQVDLGLEAELPTPPGDWGGRVLLDWGPVPGSYGWVFPKGDTLTVGVIGARGQDLRTYYRAYLDRLGLTLDGALNEGGHLTRVRAPDSPVRRGRVLAAGDAAGLLEPWTREGISFALRSGAIAGAAAAGDPTAYDEAVLSALEPELVAGRAALRAFERHPGAVHRALRTGRGKDLFARLVDGRTTLAEQWTRRPVRMAAWALSTRAPLRR